MTRQTPTRQRGVAAVEFAVVAVVFFMLFFGIVDIIRALYICNILQEVTRRATALAVNSDFSDATAMLNVRTHAVFRTTRGALLFADPITDDYVKIDYLHIPATSDPVPIGTGMPASPRQNRINCTSNPNAANCIQLVRVRICLPGSASGVCDPVPYQTLTSFVPFSFGLPTATTIARAETLGMPPGVPVPTGGS
ncbi:pilus assembly protein [Oxalobacteraceae sp. CFBP 8761]|nr:pilus assembly protein [Oxalobacteraceae sp. CFBP 8761]MBD8627000.1 pilus assembly protein [Oxalobacteraceae sp. CFBP 8753]